jgi:hypothetical protein
LSRCKRTWAVTMARYTSTSWVMLFERLRAKRQIRFSDLFA